MTLCIGALCEDRKTLVLAADRMIGQGIIQAELEIRKIYKIHPDWWVMFAGMVPNVFDVIDAAKEALDQSNHHDVDVVVAAVEQCYQKKRLSLATTKHLAPMGWTLPQFQADGLQKLGDYHFRQLNGALGEFDLNLDLLIAGFDTNGLGHIFTVANPGVASRHDIPGYAAIGVGMFGALYFMYYREVSVKMSAAEGLYHVFEGQIFGYQAGGISEETDFIVHRHGDDPVELMESKIPDLNLLWAAFKPQPIKKKKIREALNKYFQSDGDGINTRSLRNNTVELEMPTPAPQAQ